MYITNQMLEIKKQAIKTQYKNKLFAKTKIKNHIQSLTKETIKNNQKYKEEMLKKYKPLFDNINNHKLDNNQRNIIISEEDALVIAGAGSGKSLTILGKIKYLLEKGIEPDQILCLSFTNEACNNLKAKLKNQKVQILTFHKLGLEILKNNGISTKLTPQNTLKNIIHNTVKSNDLFTKIIPDQNFITLGTDQNDLEDLKKIIMLNTNEAKSLEKLLLTFINLFKGNNYNEETIDKFLKQNTKEKHKYTRIKNEAFLTLAKQIYEDYTYHLEKNKQIDFHDMINKATKIVKQRGIKNYKYIIIDEYQDTSIVKCELIQAIKKQTNAKILAVGDDFQSIYRFTGTNLDVFINFKKYFNHAEIYYLNKTYRNSKELIEVMGNFIMKNKRQIKKELISDKTCTTPIHIYYYDKNINEIINIVKHEAGKNALILGRNNNDITKIKAKNKMTVHSSKGLESENVIILGLEDKVNGFPNKIINDDVLKYVLLDNDEYPYEEERRLFYVAMTRTKNKVYLCVNKNKPSIFIQELINSKHVKIEYYPKYCKKCKEPLHAKIINNTIQYHCPNKNCK